MEKAGAPIVKMHSQVGANSGMPLEPHSHTRIPKQWASSGVISIGVSAVVVSNIDSLEWIMSVVLEESLAEMPQYISMTYGMWSYQSNRFPGNCIKEFVLSFTLRGVTSPNTLIRTQHAEM